ncbi:MAG TPA: hypothetical protein VHL50_09275 [Pyrinomonadaceae bacterium]|nr:hypothetical protein [Pyrinomonadaceae bacterium]
MTLRHIGCRTRPSQQQADDPSAPAGGADDQGIETGQLPEALLYLSRFQHGTLATRVDVDAREVTAILQAPQLADKRKSDVLEMLDAEVERILEKLRDLSSYTATVNRM